VTQVQTWKPVVETTVTHPQELWHVQFTLPPPADAGMGTGVRVEEIVCTGEHPFYARSNRGPPGFVEARSLCVGDALTLAAGGEAAVVSMRQEVAPTGQTFTTYNFEVADFHTYFAGPAGGVWVHNSGADCERVFAKVFRLAKEAKKNQLNLAEEWFKILKASKKEFDAGEKVADVSWRIAARDVGKTMVKAFFDGEIGDVDRLPTVNNWNNSFFKNIRKAETEVHHIIPIKVTEDIQKLEKLAGHSVNDVPGIPLTKADHALISNKMNPLLQKPEYANLSADDKAKWLMNWYDNNNYPEMAKVTRSWFEKRGINMQ
jgi:hypothetical protein